MPSFESELRQIWLRLYSVARGQAGFTPGEATNWANQMATEHATRFIVQQLGAGYQPPATAAYAQQQFPFMGPPPALPAAPQAASLEDLLRPKALNPANPAYQWNPENYWTDLGHWDPRTNYVPNQWWMGRIEGRAPHPPISGYGDTGDVPQTVRIIGPRPPAQPARTTAEELQGIISNEEMGSAGRMNRELRGLVGTDLNTQMVPRQMFGYGPQGAFQLGPATTAAEEAGPSLARLLGTRVAPGLAVAALGPQVINAALPVDQRTKDLLGNITAGAGLGSTGFYFGPEVGIPLTLAGATVGGLKDLLGY